MAIIASIMMLATTAFGRVWAAPPTGVDKTAAYIALADNGNQTTWAAQSGTDHKTPTALQTSTTPGAAVVLTAVRGGGTMHSGFSAHANVGQGFHSRPFVSGSFNQGFHSRSFVSGSFDRDRFMHRDFDRDRFMHRDFDRDRFRHRDFDRDDFFFHRNFHRGFGPYPYGYYPYNYYPYSYYYPYGYYPYSYYYPYGYYYGYTNPYVYPYLSLSFSW
jgi:hypothetical protein